MASNRSEAGKPTVVLVHGAFAESASWSGVLARLLPEGIHAIAAPNPCRSVRDDGSMISSFVQSIDEPVILVGHSYGGAVITNIRPDLDVRALVYVAAFAPDEEESIGELASRFPGSTLAESVVPVPLEDESADLYIRFDRFREQFCADVPEEQARMMALTQRPLRNTTLGDKSGEPAWRRIPAWFLAPELDRNIPFAVQEFMARRAIAREFISVAGASHAVAVSRPDEVAGIIRRAIAATSAEAEAGLVVH